MMYDLQVNDKGKVVATGPFDVENVDLHWLLREDLVNVFTIFVFKLLSYINNSDLIFLYRSKGTVSDRFGTLLSCAVAAELITLE